MRGWNVKPAGAERAEQIARGVDIAGHPEAEGIGVATAGGGALRYAFRFAGVGAAYFILAKAGLELASIHPSATPVWPPTGLALAAVLLWGYRLWPAIFAAAFAANAITAGSLATSAAIGAGNTLEALISAWLVNRWAGGMHAFATPLGVAKFALVGLAPGPALSATIGVASLSLAGYADWAAFAAIWKTWWLGDVAGGLVAAPFVALWASAGTRAFARAEFGASALTYAGALAVGLVAFSPWIEQTADRGALAFLAVLPLLWAALVRGPRDTATVALLLSASAVWGTLLDGGPFARITLNESFLLLIAFMISVSVPSLALSADAEQRRRTAARLTRARAASERIVEARTAELVDANAALEAALAQRARTEAELREQSLHLIEAQRLASIGSWAWNTDENRITWSDTLYEIFGLRPAEFPATYEAFLARVHPDDRARLSAVIGAAVESGGDFRMDERIVRPGGEIRHLQGSGRAIAGPDGKVVRLLGVCQDVTEQHRARAALLEAKETLHQAQKMEALGQLTGGIAHDFNNILTAVANSLELVRGSPSIDARQKTRLDRALQAARNGAALVQQLLVFARKQPVQAEPCDVRATLRATMTMIERMAGENIEVIADLGPELRRANIDPAQLQSVILNLAVNARDAMPSGGTLRITGANVRPVGARPAPACIYIAVTDSGLGMTPEVQARAFEPFFTTKEIGKGTGLGLSMVYSAIRQVGGAVEIDSAPGRGTTVRLLLPAADSPATQPVAPPRRESASAAAGGGVRILYVEDELLVRLATIDLLASAGYVVHEAPDAERALALLDSEPAISLMVTDVGLPRMDGHELAAEARRRRPGLKVVFLTGYDRARFAGRSTEALLRDSGIRYLDKPYQPEDLFRALGDLATPEGAAR
jgi:PAS domain S-box-containing protein